ncbi:MAG: type VI secretion system baseplate subunit TssE [Nitrospirota bacterium]|nr:type VI secretion system baseplate subunit TssE [Nitrospirota bacterium]MDE3118203.1 type VI secretion system baseplate subunit TssE [Nitrospirota bacterium]MDE3224803.1 type VI secretion system baseplate subunit TssE [Nitrospirota bacterium]MDE3242670.1 type VI secretion system baseplate subunit TssE [Nitrospirota bacterium]
MSEQRLLERISQWEEGTDYTASPSADTLVRSLLRHLQRILNTKQGSVPIDDTFGVPDYTNLAGSLVPGTPQEIEVGLRQVIERFEPRLKSPHVKLVSGGDDPLSLRFELSGTVAVDDRDIPIHLSTVVSANGKVSVYH